MRKSVIIIVLAIVVIFLLVIFYLFLTDLPGSLQGTKEYSNQLLSGSKAKKESSKLQTLERETVEKDVEDISGKNKPFMYAVEGKIAFISKEGEIWAIDADGFSLEQLTDDENIKFHMSISPNGKYIAYSFYPEDSEQRTNSGLYVGFNSGVAVVAVDSKEIRPLVTYGSERVWYPTWSPDSRYISLWINGGERSDVYDFNDEELILSLEPERNSFVSPVIWVPNSDDISYIVDGKLTLSQIDGQDEKVLTTGVDSWLPAFEGPNIPLPLRWSPKGRYVVYFKNRDLFVYDTENEEEVMVMRGTPGDALLGKYVNVQVKGFDTKESKLYLEVDSGNRRVEYFDLSQKAIGSFSADSSAKQSRLSVSPDGSDVITISDKVVWKNLRISSTQDYGYRDCPELINFSNRRWAGNFSYTYDVTVWPSHGLGIMGYSPSQNTGIDVVNLNVCQRYNIISGMRISAAAWFPENLGD